MFLLHVKNLSLTFVYRLQSELQRMKKSNTHLQENISDVIGAGITNTETGETNSLSEVVHQISEQQKQLLLQQQ